MYDFEDDEGEISILDLIKVAFGINKFKKLLFIIITFVLTIVLTLVLIFAVSKPKKIYTSSFDYEIASLNDNKYLDGTSFNYNSIISYDNLSSAKENSNVKVNIDKLYNKAGIKISYSDEEGIQYPYTITIKTKYFNSKSDAKKFVKELVKLPINKTLELVNDLDNTAYLHAFNNDTSYEDKVNNLISQANSIIDQYNDLISLYPNLYVTYNDKKVKLTELKNNAESKINSLYLDTLNAEIQKNNYVLNYDQVVDDLTNQKSNYEIELENITNIITALQNEIDRQSNTTSNELNQLLGQYLIKRVELSNKITILENQIAYGNTSDSTAFDAKLLSHYSVLLFLSNGITDIDKEVNSVDNMNIYYSTNKVIKTEGGYSVVILAGASLVLGLVIASITNLVLDLGKYKKSKEEKKKENN